MNDNDNRDHLDDRVERASVASGPSEEPTPEAEQQNPEAASPADQLAERRRKLAAVADAHYRWTQKMARTRADLWDPGHQSKWGSDYSSHHLDVEADARDSAEFWDEVDEIFGYTKRATAQSPGPQSPPPKTDAIPPGEPHRTEG